MTDQEWLDATCRLNGYVGGRLLDDGRYIALERQLYGAAAIIRSNVGDDFGRDDYWRYNDLAPAMIALAKWDGQGDPEGWVKHSPSNRRVSQSPDEIAPGIGRVGAVGVVYIRP